MALVILAVVSFVIAMTRDWLSKWSDRWFFTAVALTCLAMVPIVVGMIHDC